MRRAACLLALPFFLACGSHADDDADDASGPTYAADVKPILDGNCVTCHQVPPQNGAPSDFRLDQYDTVGGVAGAFEMRLFIKNQVSTGAMPPSGLVLSSSDAAIVVDWVDAGAP